MQREKKDEREHQQQTNDDERTAANRGGEVRGGVERAESGRVREGAFSLLFFLFLLNSFLFLRHHHHFHRWLCVLNHVMMRSRRARSARCLLGFQRQQQPAKSPNAFTSARAAAEE